MDEKEIPTQDNSPIRWRICYPATDYLHGMWRNPFGLWDFVTTKAEKEHMAKVAGLGCCICGAVMVHVHHAGTGMGGRRDHMKVLPLCYNHHQGKQGIHTLGRKVWGEKFGTEEYHLQQVEREIYG